MKRFEYTVKGLDSEKQRDLVLMTVSASIPEIIEPQCDIENSKLSFAIAKGTISQNDAEQRLKGALAVSGFELILPEGVNNYSFVGEKPKKVRKIPVSVAVAAAAFLMAVTMLFSFVACEIYPVGGDYAPEVMGPTGNITITDEDIPDYIQELDNKYNFSQGQDQQQDIK